MSVDLEGRVALVTGAAKRTGRALALALAEAGADVAVHFQSSRDEAQAVASEIESRGRRAALVQVDLTDPAAVERAFGEATRELGRLDILVNNVGTIVWKRFEDLSPDDWTTCLDGTLFATLNASRAALPSLRASGRGRIINILDADADSTAPVPFATAYKIGKRATFTLTKTLAELEAEHGITVNAVSPGTLDDSPTKPPLDRIPAGRYGTYEDIAQAVLFLAGDEAAYVNGVQLKVSGGYLI
jgi:NAD(P)-dependent dehydrogenase (short-subunit alcohol dehydrogenase family)